MAVLTPEQKENGVIVIDLGGGTSDYLVYGDQAIACAGSLAIGGDHITNDIALGLKIPMGQAERLKRESGSAVISSASRSQTISMPAEGGFTGKTIRLFNLHTIINARAEETLQMIREAIEPFDVLSKVGAGVVLCGGASHLPGMEQLVESTFDLPCTVGRPKNISGLAIVTEGPEYAAPIGMIRYGFSTAKRRKPGGVLGIIRTFFGQ